MPGQYPTGTKSKMLLLRLRLKYMRIECNGATDLRGHNALSCGQIRNLIITTDAGNFNNYPGIDVGDLGKIAYSMVRHLRMRNGTISHMDINSDGKSDFMNWLSLPGELLKDN